MVIRTNSKSPQAYLICYECGAVFPLKKRGRRSMYCKPACKHKAWRKRKAVTP